MVADGRICVWGLRQALEDDLSGFGAVISINHTGQDELLVASERGGGFEQLVLTFDDITRHSPGYRMPELSDVRRAIEFGRQHRHLSLMVHCKQGVSRSTAIATAILADRLGLGLELDAVRRIAASVSCYDPNRAVLSLADLILDRSGALVAAVLENRGH